MPLLPPNVDYSDKDFDSLRVRLRALLHTVFPEWTDENVANFGNILLEMFAFVGDVLMFYLDNHARESRIVSATQRRSLIALGKLLGFVPSTAEPATVDVTLSVVSAAVGSITFPAGTIVSTLDVADPVQFQLLSSAVIAAGQLSTSASVEQSTDAEDEFTSDTLPDQEFILSTIPYLSGSTLVVASDGAYVEVENFLSSTSSDRHFAVLVDQDGRARVRFGSGTNGTIPVGTISVTYRVGGGSRGNVAPGTIQRLEGTFTDAFGTPVSPSVTNPLKAAGGIDAMTNAQIRSLAPMRVRTPRNSISREDFVINAMRVSGVVRALMLTSNEDATVTENSGDLYIVPSGGGYPSDALKVSVTTMVTTTYPPPLTFTLIVRDAIYKAVNISATVYLSRGAVAADVKAAVLANLTTFFAITNTDGSANTGIDFGANLIDETGTVTGLLAFSDIFNVVRDSAGVLRVGPGPQDFLLNTVRADVLLGTREFPVLGTLTLINGLTGASL